MLNQHQLINGQIYFTQLTDLQESTFQTDLIPDVITFEIPKLLPYLSAWDNLLLTTHKSVHRWQSLLDQFPTHLRYADYADLSVSEQLLIQFFRAIMGQNQLVIFKNCLDNLKPTAARQFLKTIQKLTTEYQLIVIFTTNQRSVFEAFQSQVL